MECILRANGERYTRPPRRLSRRQFARLNRDDLHSMFLVRINMIVMEEGMLGGC